MGFEFVEDMRPQFGKELALELETKRSEKVNIEKKSQWKDFRDASIKRALEELRLEKIASVESPVPTLVPDGEKKGDLLDDGFGERVEDLLPKVTRSYVTGPALDL